MSRHLKVLHSMKFHIGEIVSYSKLENSSWEWFQKSYNPGHNISELYNILVRVRFTTSKTKRDIQYSKLIIRVAERLKTLNLRKLGNIRKISSLGGHTASCLVCLQEIRLCQQQLKNTQKQIFSCPVLLDFSILFQILCPGLQVHLGM